MQLCCSQSTLMMSFTKLNHNLYKYTTVYTIHIHIYSKYSIIISFQIIMLNRVYFYIIENNILHKVANVIYPFHQPIHFCYDFKCHHLNTIFYKRAHKVIKIKQQNPYIKYIYIHTYVSFTCMLP